MLNGTEKMKFSYICKYIYIYICHIINYIAYRQNRLTVDTNIEGGTWECFSLRSVCELVLC